MLSLLATLTLLTGGGNAPVTPSAPAPVLTSGPAYLLLSPDTRQMTHAGKPVKPEQVNLRVFRQVWVAADKTMFEVPGVGEVTVKGPLSSLSRALWPLAPDDAELRQVRAQYAGQTVYLRSGGMTCKSGLDVGGTLDDGGQGVKILNIYRLNRPYDVETRGFDGGGPYQTTAQAYAVIFAGKSSLNMGNAGGSDEKQLLDFMKKGAASPACARLSAVYADPLMLSRFLSLTPPPASVISARKSQASLVGRTAEEALWLAGIPDLTPGTPAELVRLNEWHYSNLPGLGDGVVRLENGRVVSEDWPHLP